MLALVGAIGLAACQPVPPTTPLGVGATTTTTTISTTTAVPPTDGWTLVGGDEFLNNTELQNGRYAKENFSMTDKEREEYFKKQQGENFQLTESYLLV